MQNEFLFSFTYLVSVAFIENFKPYTENVIKYKVSHFSTLEESFAFCESFYKFDYVLCDIQYRKEYEKYGIE